MTRSLSRDRSHKQVALGCLAAALALSPLVHADPTDTDRAVARTLFDDARALMAAKNPTDACPKFAESMRLDPKGGTLLNLAVCHETQGKIATAWLEFRDAVVWARRETRSDRETLAQQHITALEPQVSRLTIVVKAEVPDLTVRFDGTGLGRAAWGSTMPVDPGKHVVDASAPGRATWHKEVLMEAKGERQTIEVPALEPESLAGSAANPTAGGAVAANASSTSPPSSPRSNTVGYIAGAVGLAGLTTGAIFGVLAMNKWNDAKNNHCPNNVCDSQAPGLSDEANKRAWISDIGLGVGIVGVGLGAYLLWMRGSDSSPTAPSTSRAPHMTPLVGVNAAGMSVTGSW